jgi:rod shape-determining protein MreC
MLKKHYIALALVLLLALVVFNLPSATLLKFKLAIGSLFIFPSGLAGSARQLGETAGNAILPRGELVRQNEQLRLENEQLKLRASQTEETWRENVRLRQALKWQQNDPAHYKLARVVAREPSNWWRTIQIDLGSRDGMRTNFPVRTVEGLIGRISTVGVTRSQVLLLGDPNLKVGGLVQSPDNRESGVITAQGGSALELDMVTLAYLPRNTTAKPGQGVVTSGDGGLFPKGIPIGQIVDLRPVDFGIATEARVKLAAKLNALEEVWVMIP